jgi:hypothetical protein
VLIPQGRGEKVAHEFAGFSPTGGFIQLRAVVAARKEMESAVCLETAWKGAGVAERPAFASPHGQELVAAARFQERLSATLQ